MALFLDTIDLNVIARSAPLGVFAGVTTNPKLLSALPWSERRARLDEIAALKAGSLYVQVAAADAQAMERQALQLAEIAPGRIVIKAPMGAAGLELCGRLRPHKLPICVTAVFSSLQAYAAACAGARSVALYIGRIERLGGDGLAELRRAAAGIAASDLPCRVLAASVVKAEHLAELVEMPGVDVTIPPKLQAALLEHPGTEEALEEFAEIG